MNRNDKSFMVEKIRTKYVEKKDGSLDELRKLDRKAKITYNEDELSLADITEMRECFIYETLN